MSRTLELLGRVSVVTFVVTLLAAACAVAGAIHAPSAFLPAWLFSFLFVLSLPLGALAVLLLHQLTGGSWGDAIQPFLRAAARTLPFLALAFVPIALGLDAIFPWTAPGALTNDAALAHKASYLSSDSFLLRAAIYFVVWIGSGFALESSLIRGKGFGAAAPALLLYFVTMTFAAFDWAMSLEPRWYSSVYGMLFISGQGLSAFALGLFCAAVLFDLPPFSERISVARLHDVSKLTFAFVMLWGYISFAQLLIIWSGNLADEVPWYIRRTSRGFDLLSIVLVVCELFLPFFVLLGATAKRSRRIAGGVALWLLVMRALEVFWLIKPAFDPTGLDLALVDVAVPVLLTGVWVLLFVRSLRRVAVAL